MTALRSALVTLAALPALFALPCGAADPYPTKSIRLVVPFAPGGSNDIMARLIGQAFTEGMGQQVVIDNRAGASGVIGCDIVAKAPPDGYTLLMMSLTMAVNPSLFRKLPFDTEKDLLPITLVASAPLMLVVHPSIPAKSVQELVAHAKANPGKLNFGSGGPGTTPHLAGEMLKTMAGLQLVHIPYKGGGPALADLVGGQIQLMLENIPSTLNFAQSGKLRALAVTSMKRSPLTPNLPTLDEAGIKGYELVGWNGLFAPAGTPRAVVTEIHAQTRKALDKAEVKSRLATLGAEGFGTSPDEFRTFMAGEMRKWSRVAREAGLKAE